MPDGIWFVLTVDVSPNHFMSAVPVGALLGIYWAEARRALGQPVIDKLLPLDRECVLRSSLERLANRDRIELGLLPDFERVAAQFVEDYRNYGVPWFETASTAEDLTTVLERECEFRVLAALSARRGEPDVAFDYIRRACELTPTPAVKRWASEFAISLGLLGEDEALPFVVEPTSN